VRKLTVDEILDLRGYERRRPALRAEIIELKKSRRIHVGEFITLVFENTDTMRFQVHEMARAEKMVRDEQIAHEVATYNALIPDPGQLSCTMFIELAGESKLRDWLPRLVGIEASVEFVLAGGEVVRGYDPDAGRLTRADITAAVHFVKFDFTEAQRERFVAGPVHLRIDHPAYRAVTQLDERQHRALSDDFAEDAVPRSSTGAVAGCG
jgi:hypothetical protein